MTSNAAMGEKKRCRPVEDLLPGILDDIVLDKIVPKLEWKDFYILSSVSCAWYNAIRSRRVFDLRVLSHSSETFVVCCTRFSIALYSMRDNSWHKLPSIAGICGGQDRIPGSAQYISMDEKIYVLGGVIGSKTSNKVFVFDLVGQGCWEQCASMKQRRKDFGSAVMDGKIYVFGGRSRSLLCSAEVYEPKEDAWSRITPMATCRFGQHVTPIGEELFTYGGCLRGSGLISLDAYHPFKDEWRVVQRSWDYPRYSLLFTVLGDVFSVDADYTDLQFSSKPLALRKYDVHRNSFSHVCSFWLDPLIPVEYESLYTRLRPDAVFVVDDELIVLVSCVERKTRRKWGVCLFESIGLCRENQKIYWKLRAFKQGPETASYCFVQKL